MSRFFTWRSSTVSPNVFTRSKMATFHLSGEKALARTAHSSCFPRLFSVFAIRRRHFRRPLYITIVLFTLVLIFKVQQLINNLTGVHNASPRLQLRWTNGGSDRSPSGQARGTEQTHSAEYGVRQVKQLSVPARTTGSLKSKASNASDGAPLSGDDLISEGSGYNMDDSEPNRQNLLPKTNFSGHTNEVVSDTFGHLAELEHGLVYSGSGKKKVSPAPALKRRDLFLTVLVISKPNNVLLRQAIRKTWSKDASEFGVWVRFVVGREENWNDIVDREDNMHQDVIVVEEEDTYEYLPYKVLDGITWVLHQNATPKFVMKVDDDTIVNLPYLMQELHSGIINTTQILGAIYVNATVIRDPTDKWAVSMLDYPFTVYPTYAFGGGYAMSISAASVLIDTRSKTFDWLHLEDVYITGILAMKAGISHVTHPGFSYWSSEKASACDFVQDKRITSVNHTEKEMYSLYTNIQSLLRSGNLTECGKQYNKHEIPA